GYALMPWLLYSAYRLGSEGRLIHYATTALLFGSYLLTHLPVGYLFTFALAAYALLWSWQERNIGIILRIVAPMALGLLLSSIYWLPAALESKYVYEWASEYMPYHTTYITLLKNSDTFDFIVNSSFVLLVASIAGSVWMLKNASLPGDAFAWDREYPRDSALSHVRLWTILAVLALFMSTPFSIRISKLIPRIDVATPAWRWLAIATFFASLLFAAAVSRVLGRAGNNRIVVWAYRGTIVALCAVSLWITVKYAIVEPVRTRQAYPISSNHLDSGFTPKDSTRPDK